MELDPPAPSTNSTLETIVFSSTIIPQSVQTDDPDGPSDSILVELQFGQWNVDVAAAVEVVLVLPFFPVADDVSPVSLILPITSVAVLPATELVSAAFPPSDGGLPLPPTPLAASSSALPSSFQKLSSNFLFQSVMFTFANS